MRIIELKRRRVKHPWQTGEDLVKEIRKMIFTSSPNYVETNLSFCYTAENVWSLVGWKLICTPEIHLVVEISGLEESRARRIERAINQEIIENLQAKTPLSMCRVNTLFKINL
ncbi:MAG: hypothetical protein V4473_01370 [Patescibacteria group bacterium]